MRAGRGRGPGQGEIRLQAWGAQALGRTKEGRWGVWATGAEGTQEVGEQVGGEEDQKQAVRWATGSDRPWVPGPRQHQTGRREVQGWRLRDQAQLPEDLRTQGQASASTALSACVAWV